MAAPRPMRADFQRGPPSSSSTAKAPPKLPRQMPAMALRGKKIGRNAAEEQAAEDRADQGAEDAPLARPGLLGPGPADDELADLGRDGQGEQGHARPPAEVVAVGDGGVDGRGDQDHPRAGQGEGGQGQAAQVDEEQDGEVDPGHRREDSRSGGGTHGGAFGFPGTFDGRRVGMRPRRHEGGHEGHEEVPGSDRRAAAQLLPALRALRVPLRAFVVACSGCPTGRQTGGRPTAVPWAFRRS